MSKKFTAISKKAAKPTATSAPLPSSDDLKFIEAYMGYKFDQLAQSFFTNATASDAVKAYAAEHAASGELLTRTARELDKEGSSITVSYRIKGIKPGQDGQMYDESILYPLAEFMIGQQMKNAKGTEVSMEDALGIQFEAQYGSISVSWRNEQIGKTGVTKMKNKIKSLDPEGYAAVTNTLANRISRP